MDLHVYYADRDFGPFRERQVVVLDLNSDIGRGWAATGYLVEIEEKADGDEGPTGD